MIKVSVIIPTYKRPAETAKCIELLSKSQKIGEEYMLEIIVVDSSPDQSTYDEIKKYEENFDLNYIYLNKQTLPGEARNLAVSKAKYELIFSLDSDIEAKNDTLPRMIDYMQKHPSVAKLTGKSIFSSGENKDQIDRPTKWDRTHLRNMTEYIEGIYGRYEMFYKSAFLSVGGFDPLYGSCGEGTDLSIRFWRYGYPLAIDNNIEAFHNSAAPGSLRRVADDRMTAMYRSLMLIAYKCSVSDINKSQNFVATHEERRVAYGEATEYFAIVTASNSIKWFADNYKAIEESKQKVSNNYDFKPFDVFSETKLLEDCLESASLRLEEFYKEVFGLV